MDSAKRKMRVGGVRVYTRHSANCKHRKDATHAACDCPKWFQYQLDKKQVREPAGTRSFEQAKKFAADRDWGEAPAAKPGVATVEQAVQDWLAFRAVEGKGNRKAKFVGQKLVDWCRDNGIVYLREITTNHTTQFFMLMSEVYASKTSKTSNSLRVHWSLVKAFFQWVIEEKLISESPLARRAIRFQKSEVVVPTAEEIQKALAAAEGTTKLLMYAMRYSGMAILDTTTLGRADLTGNLIKDSREKSKVRFRVRIPQWLAEALQALPGDQFFMENGATGQNMAVTWGKRLRAVFAKAGVKMTPHRFRHYFISEQLANGVPVDDVSAMVGTSPQEIRKTYQHWIKAGEDRLDAVQSQVWLRQGLDENGNQKGRVQ